MSRQVWKFGPIAFGWTKVQIPTGFKFGHFGIQGNGLYFWAEVDPKAFDLEHDFIVVPTGCDVPLDAFYLATAVDGRSGTVWHLYMRH